MVHISLQASLPPSYWRQIYSPFVSRWFRGFPKMVSSDIAVAGRCGAAAEEHGRAHLIQTPCGWWRFDENCPRRKPTRSGNKKLGRQKNENNPQGFAQVRIRHLGNQHPQERQNSLSCAPCCAALSLGIIPM